MALIPCAACGAELSPKALACPKCGAPTRASARARSQTIFLVAGLLMISGILGAFFVAMPLAWLIAPSIVLFVASAIVGSGKG